MNNALVVVFIGIRESWSIVTDPLIPDTSYAVHTIADEFSFILQYGDDVVCKKCAILFGSRRIKPKSMMRKII